MQIGFTLLIACIFHFTDAGRDFTTIENELITKWKKLEEFYTSNVKTTSERELGGTANTGKHTETQKESAAVKELVRIYKKQLSQIRMKKPLPHDKNSIPMVEDAEITRKSIQFHISKAQTSWHSLAAVPTTELPVWKDKRLCLLRATVLDAFSVAISEYFDERSMTPVKKLAKHLNDLYGYVAEWTRRINSAFEYKMHCNDPNERRRVDAAIKKSLEANFEKFSELLTCKEMRRGNAVTPAGCVFENVISDPLFGIDRNYDAQVSSLMQALDGEDENSPNRKTLEAKLRQHLREEHLCKWMVECRNTHIPFQRHRGISEGWWKLRSLIQRGRKVCAYRSSGL